VEFVIYWYGSLGYLLTSAVLLAANRSPEVRGGAGDFLAWLS